MQKTVNSDLPSLGLSPWIRFFECVSQLSYRLEIKSWQARGAENKSKVAEKKNKFKSQLSEEVQEVRNKHSRKFRELFTRKTSRIDTNKDLINRLLLTSDSFIANLCPCPKPKRGDISNEVCEFLEIRASAPIDQDAILSEFSDTEESESDIEESYLDSE
ncbi:hypothetical protein AVEN_119782-1 [Araneus ventricosus]|uniref:Uncharacterized protein n=1 Tax=Araneus ventricosus TaxID=182803 RepID=A0A4Y2KBC5_ARAVE|nr:hypothetical protein AVEN_119782-1 [Araneus ventricosus]